MPSEESEVACDLCRAYRGMVLVTKRMTMRFSAMLLRHGFVQDERTPMGNLRPTWTKAIMLPVDAESQALNFYLKTVLVGFDRHEPLVRRDKRPNVAKVVVASELVREMRVLGNIVWGELAQA